MNKPPLLHLQTPPFHITNILGPYLSPRIRSLAVAAKDPTGDYTIIQWIFQVPVKGGRDYITP